jgi:hypothetical protein
VALPVDLGRGLGRDLLERALDDICKYKDYLRISERVREEYCTDSDAVFLKDDDKFKDKKGNMRGSLEATVVSINRRIVQEQWSDKLLGL